MHLVINVFVYTHENFSNVKNPSKLAVNVFFCSEYTLKEFFYSAHFC